MLTALAFVAVLAVQADEANMKFVAKGATAKVGGYRPMHAEMDGKAESVKKAPEGLTAAKYGELKIGDKSWLFIVDEPEGKPAKLYVDTNGDGDLTNDPQTTWTGKTDNNLTMYQGTAEVDLGDGKIGALGMYRFDPSDGRRAQLKNTMMFYTDYGYEISVSLDGKEYSSTVAGRPDRTSSLWIDRDGNGQKSYKREMISVEKPFNFTGTSYVLKLNGERLSLEKASEEVALTPMPPDLAMGKKTVPFKIPAMDSKEIDFPKSYAGKIVMLDFWATWCGPCIAELPNVKKAYDDWHGKGFEILGVSFDNPEMTEKLTTFLKDKEMPWPQIYEGKGWETKIGELYDVSAIPFVLLVDGDTGEILGTSKELRGPGLSAYVEKALAKKNRTVE